jgi:hypothetical protein
VVLVLVALCALTPSGVAAQTTGLEGGGIRASIPFSFSVGETTLPAGRYLLRIPDASQRAAVLVESADGAHHAVFTVEEATSKGLPKTAELTFVKVDGRYFLDEIFSAGQTDGVQAVKSDTELRLLKKSTPGAKRHVPAEHPTQ